MSRSLFSLDPPLDRPLDIGRCVCSRQGVLASDSIDVASTYSSSERATRLTAFVCIVEFLLFALAMCATFSPRNFAMLSASLDDPKMRAEKDSAGGYRLICEAPRIAMTCSPYVFSLCRLSMYSLDVCIPSAYSLYRYVVSRCILSIFYLFSLFSLSIISL